MTYLIKRADTSKPDTVRLLTRLHKICFPGDSKPPFSKGYWWIMWNKDEPIGFCGLLPSAQWLETGYFSRAGVIPAYRGKHLQRRLIRIRINQAKRLGWIALTTDTRDNPSSGNNLFACGFHMYSPRKPWGYSNTVYWRKRL